MSEEKPKRLKFKWTKELVNIALNDGMTQEQIGRVCRVEQSVVSGWKNGKYKATEQQLSELLRRYGARLNRTTARVYLVCEEQTDNWKETEIGRRLVMLYKRRVALDAQVEEHRKADAARRKSENEAELARRKAQGTDEPLLAVFGHAARYELTADEQAADQELKSSVNELWKLVNPHDTGQIYGDRASIENLAELFSSDFAAKGRQRVVQVEGGILFRYSFCKLVGRAFRRGLDIGREPIGRWVVHDLGRGKLLLVSQKRRHLLGTAKLRWESELRVAKASLEKISRSDSRFFIPPVPPSEAVECADDAGRWNSFMNGPMSVEELLKYVDDYLIDHETLHNPHDEQVLPYLLRKALVEHGHPVPGIERITGLE